MYYKWASLRNICSLSSIDSLNWINSNILRIIGFWPIYTFCTDAYGYIKIKINSSDVFSSLALINLSLYVSLVSVFSNLFFYVHELF